MRTISRFFSTRRLMIVSLVLTMVFSSLSLQGSASTITEWSIPADLAPKGIAVSSGGLVYFAEIYEGLFGPNDQIGRLDPSSGEFTEWDLGSNPEPYGVAVNDGYVYFAAWEDNTIGRLNPSSGELVRWTIPTSDSGTLWLAVSGSFVYFAEEDGNKIGRLNPSSGEFTEWTIPTPNSGLFSLAVNGNVVYFTEYDGNKIGRLDTSSGEFTEWTIPTSSSNPDSIAVYGSLIYFTENAKIGSLNPNTGVFTEWNTPAGINPWAIAVQDSVLYFASQAHNSICRFSPSTGEFAEWTVPTSYSLPYDIAVSSGGLVYFTESGGHKIGRLDFNPVGSTTLTSSRTRSTSTATSLVSTASGTFTASTIQASASVDASSETGTSETSSTQFSDTLTYFVDARPVVDSQWTNSPPAIDGVIGAGEWPVSPEIEFTVGMGYPSTYVLPTYVYFMNDATNLYVLVDAVGDTTDGPNHDECLLTFTYTSIYPYFEHFARISGTVAVQTTSGTIAFEGKLGYSGHKIYEFAIPFSEIHAQAGQSIDFCSPAYGIKSGSIPYDGETPPRDNVWPLGLDVGNINSWGTMQFQQQPSRGPSSGPRYVGGELFTADKVAVLSPYLALISVIGVVASVYVKKIKRRA